MRGFRSYVNSLQIFFKSVGTSIVRRYKRYKSESTVSLSTVSLCRHCEPKGILTQASLSCTQLFQIEFFRSLTNSKTGEYFYLLLYCGTTKYFPLFDTHIQKNP